MGRRPTKLVEPGALYSITFKLPGEIVKQLDAIARSMQSETLGLSVTRTDVVRMAIAKYVQRRR